MACSMLARRILLLVSLLVTLALVPAATPWTDKAEAGPAISPEEAIALATGGEVGDNDFRISDMGGDLDYDALNPAVAYNGQDNQYLVVWEAPFVPLIATIHQNPQGHRFVGDFHEWP